jgi:hypothetical protein
MSLLSNILEVPPKTDLEKRIPIKADQFKTDLFKKDPIHSEKQPAVSVGCF